MKTMFNPRTGILAAMIITAGAWRLLIAIGHGPLGNFTPLGAMALFGGCYYTEKWKAYLIPLLTLWISDLFLCYFVYYHKLVLFYDGFYITYLSFALMVLLGSFIKKVSIKNIALAGIAAALMHWLITDFFVWMDGRLYPMTWQGLVTCYTVALPYLKNMTIANLLFGGIMFGSFEWIQRKYPVVQHNS